LKENGEKEKQKRGKVGGGGEREELSKSEERVR
jgi:hypothetical protein